MRISESEARKLGILPEKKSGKRSKYGARKVWVDGICFASQKEADYYCLLKIRERAGEIVGFCLQPRFVVTEGVDSQRRGTEYVADFILFFPDGRYRIVDTKGVQTEVFKLKMKSFRSRYPALKVELE